MLPKIPDEPSQAVAGRRDRASPGGESRRAAEERREIHSFRIYGSEV